LDLLLEVLLPVTANVILSDLQKNKKLIMSFKTVDTILEKLGSNLIVMQRIAKKSDQAVCVAEEQVKLPECLKTVRVDQNQTMMMDEEVVEAGAWEDTMGFIVEADEEEEEADMSLVGEWEIRRNRLEQFASRAISTIALNAQETVSNEAVNDQPLQESLVCSSPVRSADPGLEQIARTPFPLDISRVERVDGARKNLFVELNSPEEDAKSAIAQLLTLCKEKEPTVFTTEKLGSL